jgi:DNA polymerase-3 subunit delta
VPRFKPAYLIHGEDHGRIGERRARLRVVAEQESGASGFELLEGEAASPEAVALALASMTLAVGRRFVIVDGVERWKDRDIDAAVGPALTGLTSETTVAFFAREDGRAKAPAKLHAAVRAAGGEVSEEEALKPWELPQWVREQAHRLGLSLDAGAAKALVAHVGERQQRLLRELEKLAIELGAGSSMTADDVHERAADSAERRVWTLADALVAREPEAAVRALLGLRAQGERLPGMLYRMAERVRQAVELAERLERGESVASVKRSLRMPREAAERFVAAVARSDAQRLRRALETLARLELDSRGGGAPLEEDTIALRAVARIAT